MRWPFRKPVDRPDSDSVLAAQRTTQHARTVLDEARRRGEVVDRVSTRSNALRARNHFGEDISACMERK